MNSFSKTNYNSFTSTSIPSLLSYAKECCNSYNQDQLKQRTDIKNDFHYYLKNCRRINKTKIDFFHRDLLEEKIKKIKRERHPTIFVTHSNILERERLKSLPNNSDYSRRQSSNSRTINSNVSWSKTYFETNYNFINQQTTGNFINNVRTFQRKKILTLCQKERFKKYKEDVRKKEEAVQVMKYSLRKNNTLLEHFIKNLVQYVKNLNISVEKEKLKSVSLMTKKQELDIENNQLKQNISKLESMLTQYKEYKAFLLKVKFKVKDVNELPLNEKIKYGMISNLELLAMTHNKSPIRSQQTMVKRGLLRLATRRSIQRNSLLGLATKRQSKAVMGFNNQENSSQQHKQNDLIPTNIPIFESVEEFMEKWQSIENNSFKLFDKFNDNFDSLFDLKQNQKEETIIYNEKKHNHKTYKHSLISDLNKLKKENNSLTKTLTHIKSEYIKSDVNTKLTNKLKQMLLSYPIDITNIVNEKNIYSFINTNTDAILVNGIKMNKLTYMLTILEKILLCLYFEIDNFKRKNIANQLLYREWKYTIEKENRERKNRLNKLIQIQNREIINEKVLKKINKVNYKERRTVSLTPVFLINKIHKKLKIKKQKEEENNYYENMLTY